MIAYCPVCCETKESLPKPAEGTCPDCFNHMLKPECDPANLKQRTFVPTGKNVWHAPDVDL